MHERDFSRNGVLTPELLVTLLLYMAGDGRRRGYRHILDSFWDDAQLAGLPLPTEEPISAPAFCQARAKLTPAFIRTLLHGVNTRFDAAFEKDARWRGRRVLAVDGTGVNLQRSDELTREFRKLDNAYCPQAQVSTLLNVVSKVPVDVATAPYKTSERAMLIQEHVPLLMSGDILVLDRGYPGFKVFREILKTGADFVARVPVSSFFSAVEKFFKDGGKDRSIVLRPTWRVGRSGPEIPLRVVRSKREDGEDVVFITSLRKSDYSCKDIEQLYKMRWEVEEHYKTFKSAYMGQGQLHSRTAVGVRQEILAITLFHALSRYFLAGAAKHVDAPYDELSTKSACLGLAAYIVRLFVAPDPRMTDWLRHMFQRVARTRDPKRAGRSYPRRSFQPRLRWGPNGRVGA